MSSSSVRNAARSEEEQEKEKETSQGGWLSDYLHKTDVPALFATGFSRSDW